MMARWRMLFWEQWRMSGRICFVVATVAACLFVFIGTTLQHTMWSSEFDFLVLQCFVVSCLFCMMAMLLRRGKEGYIAFSFDEHLLRLPMSTIELVVCILAIRLSFLGMVAVTMMVAGTLANIGDLLSAPMIAIVVGLYLNLQTFAWGWKTIKFYVCAVAVFFWLQSGNMDSITALWDSPLYLCSTTSVVIALSFLLSYFAVRRQRTGNVSQYGVLEHLKRWFSFGNNAALAPFASPLHAQLWYEKRSLLNFLPAVLIGCVALAVIILIMFSFPDFLFDDDEILTTIPYIPIISLLVITVIIGSVFLRPLYYSYSFKCPVSCASISAAKLMASARLLSLALILLVPIMMGVMWTNPLERKLLLDAFSEKSIDILYVLALTVRPVLFFGCIAWVLLWWRIRLVLAVALTVSLLMIFSELVVEYGFSRHVLAVFVFFSVLVLSYSGWQARRHHLFSSLQTYQIAICWIVVAGVGFFLTWFIAQHIGTALFMIASISFLCLPIFVLPLELMRQRAR